MKKGSAQSRVVNVKHAKKLDQGQSVDLIELDAASHTGVDHMREILENAQYVPTKNLYKNLTS